MWAHVNLGSLVVYMSTATRNTKKFNEFLLSFVERSASILSGLQDSEENIVHTETSKLQQDKEINVFIFCQGYPIPVAISAYMT